MNELQSGNRPESKTRVPLAMAQDIAATIVRRFEPVCTRIIVAGSIRRLKPTVADVEIVLIPRYQDGPLDLLGEPTDSINLQFELVNKLVAEGIMADRLDKNGQRARGLKMQRMLYEGFPVDLFAVTPESWGVQLAIRTGPAEFSHRFMTPRPHGNMPFGMRVEGGRLLDRGRPVDTPEEEDFFMAIEMPWIEPEDRR